ncbi:MAG: hypothetical protein AB1505_15885 [Candidatus Latescibacterota bacterium]
MPDHFLGCAWSGPKGRCSGRPLAAATRLLACGLVLLLGAGLAQARSTFTVQVVPPAVAGPGHLQPVELQISYFPGDGEAVVGLHLAIDGGAAVLGTARSARGETALSGDTVRVGYARRPLAGPSTDTVTVELVPAAGVAEVPWGASLFSSLDPDGEPAHRVSGRIAVRPPVGAQAEVLPAQVFPGERVGLRLVVHNRDPLGRALERVRWRWPEGLAAADASPHRWPRGLPAGAQDTLRSEVAVAARAHGRLALGGTVDAEGVAGSPLPPAFLEVALLPTADLATADSVLQVGSVQEVVCTWRNPGPEPLTVEALRLEIGAGFEEVRVVGEGSNGWSVQEHQGQQVLLGERRGGLGPGQQVALRVQVRPVRAGPFRWQAAARPALRQDFLPLAGSTALRVVRPQAGARPTGREEAVATDLELIGRAFAGASSQGLADLPLPPGSQVYLRPTGSTRRNWVVEDALAASLQRAGYRIRLSQPGSQDGEVSVLEYRLVDARVIYAPAGRGWKVWQGRQRREAVGDLFVQLTDGGGRLRWAGRLRALAGGPVPAGHAEWLQGGEGFQRTEVQRDAKLVERGLSASIIGGLIYIFFVL